MLASMMRRLAGREQAKMFVAGLDASGRTTMLMRLKGVDFRATPTIGFNVETVEYEGVAWTIWEVGGGDKIRPLWRHYLPDLTVCAFMFDGTDRQRLDEAAREFITLAAYPEVQCVPFLVLLNKIDVEGAVTPEELRERIDNKVNEAMESGRLTRVPFYHVQPCVAETTAGVLDGLAWANAHRQWRRDREKNTLRSQSESFADSGVECFHRLAAAHSARADEADAPALPGDVVAAMAAGRAPPGAPSRLSHGDLVCVLAEARRASLARGQDFRAASAAAGELLQALHRGGVGVPLREHQHGLSHTAVMFWCYVVEVHLAASAAAAGAAPSVTAAPSAATPASCTSAASGSVSSTVDGRAPEEAPAVHVPAGMELAAAYPHLLWRGLWRCFYSLEVWQSRDADGAFVLPDLAPLPFIVGTLAGCGASAAPGDDAAAPPLFDPAPLSDREFFMCFEDCTLAAFDERCLVRACFVALQLMRERGERRGAVVKRLMDSVQALTIKLRASGPGAQQCVEHSETRIYFWVQMVACALASVAPHPPHASLADVAFEQFMAAFPELEPGAEPWRAHYSQDAFTSAGARREFVPPDKAPLPNVLSKREVKVAVSI